MSQAAATAGAPTVMSSAYRTYAMVLLMCIYTVNFLDRQVINILAEPIKEELKLADWQLGMMSGLMFALFYTVLGIPIARLAERKNRPWIIASAVAVWSGFTALCGTATGFVQLCLFRIGVGIGEAGCTPPSHSLITDYTPKEKRASALAFYSIGTPLGALLGLAMGGLVADAYGWRTAFLVAGVPGILFAILAATTLREPRRASGGRAAAPSVLQATFGATMKLLFSKQVFWLVAFAASIKAFIGYGHAPFTPSFFLRNHPEQMASLAERFGMQSLGFTGIAVGLISGFGGIVGAILGGYIADRWGKKDLRVYMVFPAIASLINIPIYTAALMVPNAMVGIGILAVYYCMGTLWYGPVYATTQGIVPPHMRATAAAILLLIINLIGLGLGPLLTGLGSDILATFQLRPAGLDLEACKTAADAARATCAGASAYGVKWALILSTFTNVIAFTLFWMARKNIRKEMES